MIKESLFAAEERETKLDKLGDVLQILENPSSTLQAVTYCFQ